MSFLARATRTAAATRLSTITPTSSRLLSTTAIRSSGPIDATKSTLKKADRKVADAAVKGIETGGTHYSQRASLKPASLKPWRMSKAIR